MQNGRGRKGEKERCGGIRGEKRIGGKEEKTTYTVITPKMFFNRYIL